MLLPSGSDTVQKTPSRETRPSTPLTGAGPHKPNPPAGIRPCYSGLQVQGTATSPPSTANIKIKMAEREGFEPSRRFQYRLLAFQASAFSQLGHLSAVHSSISCLQQLRKDYYTYILSRMQGFLAIIPDPKQQNYWHYFHI